MSPDAAEQPATITHHVVPRRYVALGLIVLAIILLAALVVIRDDNTQSDTATAEVFTPVPSSLLSTLTTLPAAISNEVGATSPVSPITAPTPTGAGSIWVGHSHGETGLPVVFFYGAEFAPYAAAERWPVIVALSRFGTFGPIGMMQSSGSAAPPGIETFTFSETTFSSRWVDLQSVERYSNMDPTGSGYTPLQNLTAHQAAAVAFYDSSTSSFPMLDIANRYVLVGSSFTPSILAGQSQAQIAADLAYPTSPLTQAIVASANELTATICAVTGQRPTKVCSAKGVVEAAAKLKLPAGQVSG
jgi:hypothetical protein